MATVTVITDGHRNYHRNYDAGQLVETVGDGGGRARAMPGPGVKVVGPRHAADLAGRGIGEGRRLVIGGAVTLSALSP